MGKEKGRLKILSSPVHYEPHRPEQTTLYRLVHQHAATFIVESEVATGADLPQFVKDEFDAFLECDIPCPRLAAPALRRLRPRQAGRLQLQAARLLPLVRRQAHGAGGGAPGRQRHPHVPVRQWVLSLPIPLRLRLAAQPKLVTPVQQVVRARPLAPAPLALAPVRPSS